MKPTSNRPAPFLTAMLEGSFSCLIFLATIALVAPDAKAKQYALIGFAAEVTSLGHAFWLVVLSALVIAAFATKARAADTY